LAEKAKVLVDADWRTGHRVRRAEQGRLRHQSPLLTQKTPDDPVDRLAFFRKVVEAAQQQKGEP
jgi:hypothetical protein